MPLTSKGEEIKSALVKEYGEKKGESVLYSGKNAGTFTGIDARMDKLAKADAAISEMNKNADWLGQRMDAMASRADADYAVAKAARDALQAEVDRTADELKRIAPNNVKSAMGLTPDSIKSTPEWKAAKFNYDRAFQNLRNFNGTFVSQFKKEIREERRY